MTRRDYLQVLGAAAAMAQTASSAPADPASDADRERRMKWWHEARFGMFIHWGVYSTLARHEWVMENEGIPVAEYAAFAKSFTPKPKAARAWAKLARAAGQKYMVMTTKHHEGFCLFDSKLTDYCAPKQGPGRDLVAEYVEAARAEGRRVGFYYSLMDWHHPDGARCATDEQARRRFVDYIHGQIHELLTNYGKIDVLWYDVAWPLDANGWESEKMNKMVFELQPDIIVNNRNKLDGDFATPEQRIEAAKRSWESCMTMNGSWGYQKADDDWKTPRTVIRNLISCSRDGGNYLLNIGPKGDGSIPDESVKILSSVGRWMDHNSASIYDTDPCQPRRSNYASFTRNRDTLYMHVHYWPGSTVVIGGLMTKIRSARLLASGQDVKFTQDPFRVRFINLPEKAPDEPVTTLAIECDGEPKQDNEFVRRERPRT
jgi:alpha-L-fucosidase